VAEPVAGEAVSPVVAAPVVEAAEPVLAPLVGTAAPVADPPAAPAGTVLDPAVTASPVAGVVPADETPRVTEKPVAAVKPVLSPEARGLLLAYLLDPRFARDCHRSLLLGEYPTLGSAGAPGAPNGGGGIPWPSPGNAPAAAAATGGSSSRPGGDVDDWGMAALALLALLALGGKPLMAAREVLGPASVPRLIPELPG
jgi:hypothetical protein